MSLEPDAVEGRVKRYLNAVATGTADDMAAMYAEDATVEDPVGGGEVHIGRQAIARVLQDRWKASTCETEILTIRVGGHEAAFLFAITVARDDAHRTIEVMVFNGDGQITSMKAYWSPEDVNRLDAERLRA